MSNTPDHGDILTEEEKRGIALAVEALREASEAGVKVRAVFDGDAFSIETIDQDADRSEISLTLASSEKPTPVGKWSKKNPLPGKTALYRYYAEDGELLYIGISDQQSYRDKRHVRDSVWRTNLARWLRIEFFDERTDAELAELLAVFLENPEFNTYRKRPEDGMTAATGSDVMWFTVSGPTPPELCEPPGWFK